MPEPEEVVQVYWARWSWFRCYGVARNTYSGGYIGCQIDRRFHGKYCMASIPAQARIIRWCTEWATPFS